MKAILLIPFILIGFSAKAQLFVTIDPAFLQPGILYNQKVNRVGYYVRIQCGNIKTDDFYTDNIKGGSGISLPVGYGGTVYAGANYNYFFNTEDNSFMVDLDRISLVSLDIGVSLNTKRFTMMIMLDPINWEAFIGFSYQLKK
jgi:hypothetical protein